MLVSGRVHRIWDNLTIKVSGVPFSGVQLSNGCQEVLFERKMAQTPLVENMLGKKLVSLRLAEMPLNPPKRHTP